MPRNGSGTYSLPQPAFVTGTKISSSAVNSDFSDIAAALTQSVSSDGQTTMTGPLKHSNGNAAAPAVTFAGDATTGLYLPGAGQLNISIGGTSVCAITASGVTWAIAQIFPSGITISSGGANITGNSSITGTLSVSAALTVSSGGATITGNSSITGTLNTSGTATVGGLVVNNGVISSVALPTVQRFTSGSGTYTPTSGAQHCRVRMCGGGGGGGASTTNNGNAGGNTTFGSWGANAGAGGNNGGGQGGAGGSGGGTGTGNLIARIPGGSGGPGMTAAGATVNGAGGMGGTNPFGGGGGGGANGGNGLNGATNSGAGGGGGGSTFSGSGNSGAGGGAGEYVEFWITAASTSYSVGGSGSGGAAGTQSGGNGAAGFIVIEEFYV